MMPRHVAIIMDGNGRWAAEQGKPRIWGHRNGVTSVRKTIQYCQDKGVDALTLFAFSSENWNRPQDEVSMLMELFIVVLRREVKRLHKNNVRLKIIGDTDKFNLKLQQQITKAESLTSNNTGLRLNIAANFGGKWDITQAAIKLVKTVQQGHLQLSDINEATFGQFMSLSGIPEPDLFIRTGGEHRISNYLLWELAYTELYFTDTLWPDFDEKAFDQAVDSFSKRERRFGKTSAQVADGKND